MLPEIAPGSHPGVIDEDLDLVARFVGVLRDDAGGVEIHRCSGRITESHARRFCIDGQPTEIRGLQNNVLIRGDLARRARARLLDHGADLVLELVARVRVREIHGHVARATAGLHRDIELRRDHESLDRSIVARLVPEDGLELEIFLGINTAVPQSSFDLVMDDIAGE